MFHTNSLASETWMEGRLLNSKPVSKGGMRRKIKIRSALMAGVSRTSSCPQRQSFAAFSARHTGAAVDGLAIAQLKKQRCCTCKPGYFMRRSFSERHIMCDLFSCSGVKAETQLACTR